MFHGRPGEDPQIAVLEALAYSPLLNNQGRAFVYARIRARGAIPFSDQPWPLRFAERDA